MEDEIRDLIENYKGNNEKFEKLQTKLINLLEYNTKLTAAYGHNTGGGKGSISSKVERHALKIHETQQQLIEVADKLAMIDNAQKVLTDKENEVIELIKQGYRNRLSKIAKILKKDRKYIFDTRNKAIKKMCEYILNNI